MPSYKLVEIRVPVDYELPDLYNHKDLEVNEEALTLGAFLHEQMTYRRANADIQRLEEQKAKDIARLKADAAAKQTDLEQQIAAVLNAQEIKQQQLLEAQKAKDVAMHAGEKETIVK